LLDLPGIIEGAKDGKGRGKQVIAGKLIHSCFLIVDCSIIFIWQSSNFVLGMILL